MKYLKLFEKFLSENKLYSLLSGERIENSFEPFTQDEMDKLSEYDKDVRYFDITLYNKKTYNVEAQITVYKRGEIRREIVIDKYSDEWFSVCINTYSSTEFKCDTFEGVIQLIEDSLSNSLKIYEKFSEEEKLYYLTNYMDPITKSRSVPFNQLELNEIEKLNTNFYYIKNTDKNGYRIEIPVRNGYTYRFYKHVDEWFISRIDGYWFKCDTIDGVVQLIKDKVFTSPDYRR